jgi:2-oxo-3-hexenedioate decarboxylase
MRSTRANADGDATMTPQALLAHSDEGRLWPADAPPPADLPQAYQEALDVRALRAARGERPMGYKIGFTNRTIWQRYDVFAPIWGTVWDTTLTKCDGRGTVDLTATCQPRIEPEIVFGIAATPPIDASLEQLFGCVAWLAPGFEIVQSHCKDWKFKAPQTVADGALHARLLVGRQTPVRSIADSGQALDQRLAATHVRLFRGQTLIDEGTGINVLDGPLHALHHFMLEQQRCPGAPALLPGDVVTTGTWTDAWPVEPGQVWRSEFDAPIDGLEITFR